MHYCMVLSSQHVLPRGWPFAQDGWHTTTTMELFLVINRLEYHRLQGTSMEHNLVDAKDHVTMAKDHNALVHNQTNTTKKYMTNYLLIYFGICLCCDHHMLSISNGPWSLSWQWEHNLVDAKDHIRKTVWPWPKISRPLPTTKMLWSTYIVLIMKKNNNLWWPKTISFHVVRFVCNIDKDYSKDYEMIDAKYQRTKDHIAMGKDYNNEANNFVIKDQTSWHLSKEIYPNPTPRNLAQ